MHSGISTDDAMNLAMSAKVVPLYEAVIKFIAEEVEPVTAQFYKLGEGRADHWGYGVGQLELLDSLKAKAKARGLWNFFLPDAETGEGLSNLDYAYIAVELGKNPLASEAMNCSAPDTGNMEVLERVGTPEQKKQWLEPLLAGEIRSAYAMTEPDVASSDAKNLECRAVLDGEEWLINGEKFYISGAGDPRCKIMICMLQTSPDGPPHRRHSQILVPMDTPGITRQPLRLIGEHDINAVFFDNVRVPVANRIGDENQGWTLITNQLNHERVTLCSTGIVERAFTDIRAWATETIMPDGRRVADQEWVQMNLARVHAKLDVLRLMNWQSAWEATQGKLDIGHCSSIKVYGTEFYLEAFRLLFEILGPTGYLVQGTPGAVIRARLESMYRGMLILTFGGGTNEMQRDLITMFSLGFPRAAR